jgi:hypothetical protein
MADVNIELTTADIVAALQCSHECLSDILTQDGTPRYTDLPSGLTVQHIVDDICHGCYIDDLCNCTSRFFCLLDPSSWTSFCSEMCVHLETKLRGMVPSYLIFMPFREAFGIPFLNSLGTRCTSFGKGRLRSALRVQLHRDFLFHS